MGRQPRWSPRRAAREFFAGIGQRKRKAFSFEQLEDRCYFALTPGIDFQAMSLSNDTAEGAAAIWQRELDWAAMQYASAGSTPMQVSSYALPTDPLFTSQWHLLNTGQEVGNPDFQHLFGVAGEDINVVEAWNRGYTGEGVTVAVIDNGVQLIHPDLIPNLHPTLRFNAINLGNNPNPTLLDLAPYHGTAVAGLIGAAANNGIGGVGVAPGVQLIPVKLISAVTPPIDPTSFVAAFQFALQNDIDITNNSWGPTVPRNAVPLAPEETTALRDSIVFGRGGLGTIHVFAAGNAAGPGFVDGFESFGFLDSATYNAWVNSRYTIGVTSVDHDGEYANADGTFTSYAETSAAVLVAAPTGSNFAQNVADDAGQGSGIWTTDLVGDFGANAAPLPGGFDPDRDFLPDADYTSRFNGTSASTPLVSGVIALMLEANPNLTYRDVQEILVRSARQNAQFEIPTSGGGLISENTWRTNQIGLFRNPDPFGPGVDPFQAVYFPLMDPNGLLGRFGRFEPQPALYTNGAGYTVSQGFGVYGEQIGYAHGVVDAGLAVKMAEQWHTLGQNIDPFTERTFTTFVVQLLNAGNLPAGQTLDQDQGLGIIPGELGGRLAGFIDYWEEYFEDDPFNDYDGPLEGARGSHITFSVPDTQAMDVESVEVKVSINGPAADLDALRIMLVSPDGTQSDLNHFYGDPGLTPGFIQGDTGPPRFGGGLGNMDPDGGNFVWTFRTNRNWGERSSDAPIIDVITGEPINDTSFFGGLSSVHTRGWELHVENWSGSNFQLSAVEIVWHGKPLAVGTQRVQGFVGVDTNSDEEFNYSRSEQFVFDSDFDPMTFRVGDVTRVLDLTQEPFAENAVVEAFRVVNGVMESDPTARFLTGADGNYYFDLVPDEYIIRVTDPLGRQKLEDVNTLPQYQKHFQQEWRITKDWFFAPDRDDPPIPGLPGEIFFGPTDNDNDGVTTDAPLPFLDQFGQTVPMAVKNINFLLKQDALPQEIVVSGTVIADLNGNGQFDGDDTPAGGITVYFDANRNSNFDPGEQTVISSEDPATRGQYTITIPAALQSTYSIGVVAPSLNWLFTNPSDGTLEVFAGPGDVLDGNNFFLDPPDDAFPPGGSTEPGNILGVIYYDRNSNGVRNLGEEGIAGFRVFIDANENGIFDAGELESIASSNGTFFFADVVPGVHRIDMEEGNAWQVISPAAGSRQVALGPGGTVTGVQFGLKNLADHDWGDLPVSYNTLGVTGGPSHFVVIGANGVPGFYLGARIDGEVDGQPTADASGDDALGQDDDGVVILTNGGQLQPGANTLQVTVAGVGGLLNGWIDWNNNGQFDASEHLEFQYALGTATQADLNPGTHQLTITAPANLAGGPLAARFRWGEANLGPAGPAQFGEVEDYILASSVPAALVGDYDSSGVVDTDDLLLWNATFGSTTDLRADGSKNGEVDIADYVIWRKAFMDAQAGGSSVASGSSTGSAASATQPSPSPAPSYGPKILNSSFENSPALLAWMNATGLLARYEAAGYVRGNHGSVSTLAQGGSTNASGSVSTTSGSGVAPSITTGSTTATSNTPSQLTTSLNVLATSAARPSYRPESGRPLSGSVAAATASDNGLLLVDQALADFNADSDDAGEDSLVGYVRDDDKDEGVCDMALAAILEDEASWWTSI
jgi:subtilisin family serine protease